MVTYVALLVVLVLICLIVIISFIRTFPKLVRPFISWGIVVEWRKSSDAKSFVIEYNPVVEFKDKGGHIIRQEIKGMSAGIFRPETKSRILLLIGRNQIYAVSNLILKFVTYFGIIGLLVICIVELIIKIF